jgi:hypothetical protein
MRRERMAIRTNDPQIIFYIIFSITIDVIDFERYMSGHRMFFVPTTRRTFIFIFFEQIAAKVRGNCTRVDADCSAQKTILPIIDENFALICMLTRIRAKFYFEAVIQNG